MTKGALCDWQWNILQSCLQELKVLLGDCPDCPEVEASAVQLTETGEPLTLPYTTEDRPNSLSQTLSLTDPSGCLADNPDAEISVQITLDHEALPFDSHRGFILSASAGTFTAESASNTFETSGTTGNSNIGIGYAMGDTGNERNIRWVKLTAIAAEWTAGIALSYLGFGGVGGASESLYSQELTICEGLEDICDAC